MLLTHDSELELSLGCLAKEALTASPLNFERPQWLEHGLCPCSSKNSSGYPLANSLRYVYNLPIREFHVHATHELINQPCCQHGCPDSVVVITSNKWSGGLGFKSRPGQLQFSQKLSSVEFPLTLYIILAACESHVDPGLSHRKNWPLGSPT